MPALTLNPAIETVAQDGTCLHCGAERPEGDRSGFCCEGCRGVYELVGHEGLDRYYDLSGRGGGARPQGARAGAWLERQADALACATAPATILLEARGIHCAACIWLFEELFRRTESAGHVRVSPTTGRVELWVPPSFPLASFVDRVESFGYRLSPASARSSADRSPLRSLVLRTGIAAALAMNAMTFAIARYLGLESGAIADLFVDLEVSLALLSVLVAGPVFFRAAWASLRHRALHLDLPIAVGIALAFASSLLSWARGSTDGFYFDTLTVFLALMLVGRLLQERALERGRSAIPADDDVDGMLARRVTETGAVELVEARSIREGDELVLGPGELLVVAATPADDGARVRASLDWITGESEAKAFVHGQELPAGASSCEQGPVRVRATGDFDASPLVGLLRAHAPRGPEASHSTPFWSRLSRVYVASVLALAAAALFLWAVVFRDPARALEVTAAVLIVTCPCAFGIAAPLAEELGLARLRRAGLFVRTRRFFDRAAAVRTIAFDKTGTLTTGQLRARRVDDGAPLAATDAAALATLVLASSHPKARALTATVDAALAMPRAKVVEIPHRGVELFAEGARYRLGAASWAAPSPEPLEGDVTFSRNGELVARFTTEEELRHDAAREVALLTRGFAIELITGDEEDRALRVARACGIGPDHVHARMTPEAKAELVASLDHKDLLFVGDGGNDTAAIAVATVSGTPALDRPLVASRADFALTTAGLSPIRAAIDTARSVRRAVRLNLAVALAYNFVAVSLAFAGLMSPVLCAIVMPVSSLSTIAMTLAVMRRGAPR